MRLLFFTVFIGLLASSSAQNSNLMRLQYYIRAMANQQVEDMIETLPWALRGPVRMAMFPFRQTANMAANVAAGTLGSGISMLQATGFPGTGLLRSDFEDSTKASYPGAGMFSGYNPAALGVYPTLGYGYPSFGQNAMMGSGMLTTENPYPASQQQAQQLIADGIRYQRLRQAVNTALERLPHIASYFQSLISHVGSQMSNRPGVNMPNQGSNQGSIGSLSTLIPGMTVPPTSSTMTSGQVGSLGSAAAAALNTLREGGNSAASTMINGMQSMLNQMTGGESSQPTTFKSDLPAKAETKKERAKRETLAETILARNQDKKSSSP